MTKLYLPFAGRAEITSPFGDRILNGAHDYHKGIDLVGLDDITVRAPCDAIVGQSTVITDHNNLTWQWGNYVRLDTSDGLYIFMCHMDSRCVTVGQAVKRGQPLGVMGNTGYSFGAHTHMEVRNSRGESLNPCGYLGIPNTAGVYKNPEPEKPKDKVEDDGQSAWSKKEGWWDKAKERGIIDGTNPRGNLTREQFIAVLGRLGLITDANL